MGYGETLDWWQLALPVKVTLSPGEQRDIPLFRTFGSATTSNEHPREARVRIRCSPVPAELKPTSGPTLIELGLTAHARLAKLSATNAFAPNHADEELAKLRAEIATLRLNLGESHPKVLELRGRIAELDRK